MTEYYCNCPKEVRELSIQFVAQDVDVTLQLPCGQSCSVCSKEAESFLLSVKRTNLQGIILLQAMKGDEDKMTLLKLCDHLNTPVIKDKIWEEGRKVQGKYAHVLVMQLIATKIIEIESKSISAGKGHTTIVVDWKLVPASGEQGLAILTDEAWTQIKHH